MSISYHCLSFDALSKEQLYALLALRQEVFIVEQHCPYLDADGQDQVALHVLGLTEEGRLATYTRLLPVGVGYEHYAAIGRVITAGFARGKGLGRPLMQISLQKLREQWGDVPVKLSAQAHLQSYYQSVGFAPVGKVYMEDGIPHIGMVYYSDKP